MSPAFGGLSGIAVVDRGAQPGKGPHGHRQANQEGGIKMLAGEVNQRNVLTVIAAPHWGGLQVVVERTTPYFVQAGYRRIVAIPRNDVKSRERLESAGCTVLEISLSRPRKVRNPAVNLRYIRSFWGEIQALKDVIRSQRIDVVEVAGLLNLQPVIAARRMNAPLVWQLHSTLAPRLVRVPIGALAMRMSDVVMTSGSAMIETHGGLSHGSAEIVPFCAPLELKRFKPDAAARREIRRELGYDASTVVVGTLGNRSWQKRHEWIVAMADKLRDTELQFVIVGSAIDTNDTYYRSKVVDAIAERGLEDRVRVLEQSHPAEKIMNAFDIFVLPSVAEGASLVTAEAMATGLPVVASAVGSLPDIVRPGENGYLCPVNSIEAFCEALAELEDSVLRTRMGGASRRIAETTLGADRCAEAHFRAYRAALASRAVGHTERVHPR